jgi:Fe(3+) dicitrate transport protein
MFCRLSFLYFSLLFSSISFAREKVLVDTTKTSKMLSEVFVLGKSGIKGHTNLVDFDGVRLLASKKSELIVLSKLDANVANQSFREVFGRTPGLHVIESDPSGFNTSIAIRGLSTNRSWDFNMRQNGYDITPDPMGYNEAYYTPSFEWVEKIEIVRGAAALQYGPQVGGLINYVLEKPVFDKKFGGEVQQTFGSFGLKSSLIKFRSGLKKLAFVGSHQFREGNGFRPNSNFNSNQSYFRMDWKAFTHGLVTFELTNSISKAQLAGGISEAQFKSDPWVSFRARNFYYSHWFMPVVKFNYSPSKLFNSQIQIFAIQSGRSQLGFTKTNDFLDVPNTAGNYANRSLDRDEYTSYGAEFRSGVNAFNEKWQTSVGLRIFRGNMFRQQQGIANNGSTYSENLVDPKFPRSLNFVNQNFSAFIENTVAITPKFKLAGGLRYEYILSQGNGILDLKSNFLSPDRLRSFILWGAGASFKPSSELEIYGNASQSFRPISFSDLLPSSTTDIVDAELKDARALNFDLGIRGKKGNFLRYDISAYHLEFSDRIGNLSMKNSNGPPYLYRTNLGLSSSKGLELYAEIDPISFLHGSSRYGQISVFLSAGINHAVYENFALASGENLAGKRLENAPQQIIRSGLTYTHKRLSFTYQISYTAESFSDAQNTGKPNPTGTIGLIPGYTLDDFSFTYKYRKHWLIKGSVNNVMNVSYFTRRGTGAFPGYGILPGAPRNVSCTLGFTF